MWLGPVSVLVLVILFVWWALTRQAAFTEVTKHHDHGAHKEQEIAHSIEESPVAAVVESRGNSDIALDHDDDLTIIEGIGPKIASVLKGAGILTFHQIAETPPDRIREILMNNDPRLGRIANPSTWGEQSRMAADGKFEELKIYQNNLKGGRA